MEGSLKVNTQNGEQHRSITLYIPSIFTVTHLDDLSLKDSEKNASYILHDKVYEALRQRDLWVNLRDNHCDA